MVKAIPDEYPGITPYLCVKGAAQAIEFYKKAFGATEIMRIGNGDQVGHAELSIGNARFQLADEHPQMGFLSPQTIGGTPVVISLYVEDVDAFARRAIDAGIKVKRPVEDQFYGDRAGQFEDPFGHCWWFGTHIEDVSPEEMERRAAAAHGGGGS